MKTLFKIPVIISLLICSVISLNSCKKKPTPPVVTTTSVSAITQTTASSGGAVTNDGGAEVTARGVCWNTSENPTVSNSKTSDGEGIGTFSSSLTQLTPGTKYYVRAYATNEAGTGYGNQQSFTTGDILLATVTTSDVTSITSTTAVSGGNITSDGGASVTARGVCWGTSASPTINNSKTTDGTGTGSFTSNITGLSPNTPYYFRAYAINSVGTAYGNQLSFTTSASLATLTTTAISNVTKTSAKSGGNITSDGGSPVTARGVCWSTTENPTTANNKTIDGSGTGSFTSNITGLTTNTNYYVRAYATTSIGTAYGNQRSFTPSGTITDVEGNIYNTVTIGTQMWLAENLKTTKYNDGTSIPFVTDNTAWSTLVTPGYCWYNNDEATYKNPYGALYNWFAVNTNKLCPTGWHVPTDAEWTTLTNFLGGENVAGGKLKEAGTTHWESPNTGATNETGFTALPGGDRGYRGASLNIGSYGYWWSSTEYDATHAWNRYMYYNYINVLRSGYDKRLGFSVRCVKD